MNHTIETNHYPYDAKVLAKFQMKQCEKLHLKFGEKTNIDDFTFVGICLNASGKNLDYYWQENIKS